MNALKYGGQPINKKINYKGRDEQERSFMFPALYGNKALTRNTAGNYATFDRKNYSKRKRKQIQLHEKTTFSRPYLDQLHR